MEFYLSDDLRKDLRKALSSHGCREPEAAAVLIEDLMEVYHDRFIGPGDVPSAASMGEAIRILECAGAARSELADINEVTLGRMTRELLAREKEMTLTGYAEAVNGLCTLAVYAIERGARKAMTSERPADRELRRLVAAVMRVWRLRTGCEIPKPPAWTEYPNKNWRHARRLEQHPIWIVARGIGIRLDSYGVSILMKSAEVPSDHLRRRHGSITVE